MEPSETDLGGRLSSAFRRVDRLLNAALSGLALPSAHAQVLLCLLREGEMRQRDLAMLTGFEPSTVSRLMRALTRRKLVKSRPDPADGRGRLYAAGSRALDLQARLEHVFDSVNDRLRKGMLETDLQGFFRVTEALARLP